MSLEPRLRGPSVTITLASITSAKAEKRKISYDNFMKALRRALPTKDEISFTRLAKVCNNS